MVPIVGVIIVGGVLYLLFKNDDEPKQTTKNSEPKESLPSTREVTRLRKELKAALKKEKKLPSKEDPAEKSTTPKS